MFPAVWKFYGVVGACYKEKRKYFELRSPYRQIPVHFVLIAVNGFDVF